MTYRAIDDVYGLPLFKTAVPATFPHLQLMFVMPDAHESLTATSFLGELQLEDDAIFALPLFEFGALAPAIG
jgi:hypothetical protein